MKMLLQYSNYALVISKELNNKTVMPDYYNTIAKGILNEGDYEKA
jgi:hypothetical protein